MSSSDFALDHFVFDDDYSQENEDADQEIKCVGGSYRRATQQLALGNFEKALEHYEKWIEGIQDAEEDSADSLNVADTMLHIRLLILNKRFKDAVVVVDQLFTTFASNADMNVGNFDFLKKCLTIKRFLVASMVQIENQAQVLQKIDEHIGKLEKIVGILDDRYLLDLSTTFSES